MILTVNGGSSSIKFAAYTPGPRPTRILAGMVDRIGKGNAVLTWEAGGENGNAPVPHAKNHEEAAATLIDWLGKRIDLAKITGIGHRVVHGGVHLVQHQLVTPELVAELKRTQPLDLAHLPREIALIEAFSKRFPQVKQVACFDTAFHRDLPRVAQLLPIPLRYFKNGIRRFGFHGLSYTYLMQELERVAGREAASGRVILAHLGSGASIAAVHQGHPIDTTMAFTPTAGLVMGTRPGDLDPGLLIYMMRVEKKSPEEMDEFISRECGLIGVSETTADMRDLISLREGDDRSHDAVELFCYQVRKWIGAFAAAMNGLDTLVFSAGIGERGVPVRQEICTGLQFLGLEIDPARNAANAPIISTGTSRITVRVIKTDEEIIIAQSVWQILEGLKS